MGDVYKPVRVAAVQAASVFLDREGSTEKACRLIREAGAQGARVIGFPEGFIPAHPVWFHHHAATAGTSNKLSVELFKNSVEIPGAETEALALGARAGKVAEALEDSVLIRPYDRADLTGVEVAPAIIRSCRLWHGYWPRSTSRARGAAAGSTWPGATADVGEQTDWPFFQPLSRCRCDQVKTIL